MSDVDRYLGETYRRDILHESLEVGMPAATSELIADVRARIAAIDELRLGAHLANRAFDLYQQRRSLIALLSQLEARDAADSQGQ